MKLFRAALTALCIVASFIAHAAEQPAATATGAANPLLTAESQTLQGTWEGIMAGQETNGHITITITNNSLHFHRDTNFWFATTFTLPGGPDPKQLHATIKDSAGKDGVGKLVPAIYKIEGDTLTVIAIGDEVPKSFAANEVEGLSRYELRKVQPPTKNTGPPNAK